MNNLLLEESLEIDCSLLASLSEFCRLEYDLVLVNKFRNFLLSSSNAFTLSDSSCTLYDKVFTFSERVSFSKGLWLIYTFETDSFQEQLNRINELMDVRDTTSQLLNRISSTAPTADLSIIESMARVEIAYAIGEEIFYGEPLNDVLSGIEAIDVLPDLLSSSSDDIKIMVEEMAFILLKR